MCVHMGLVVVMVVVDFGCELRSGFWVDIRLWVWFWLCLIRSGFGFWLWVVLNWILAMYIHMSLCLIWI